MCKLQLNTGPDIWLLVLFKSPGLLVTAVTNVLKGPSNCFLFCPAFFKKHIFKCMNFKFIWPFFWRSM